MISAVILLVVSASICFAADTTSTTFTPWGAAGLYGARYSSSKGSNEFHDLLNFAPDERLGLNNIFLGMRATSSTLFGAVTLQYGDIPRSGWDPDVPWLQEAWIGYHVCDSVNVTAGAFTSAFGVESLMSFENYSGIVSVPGFFNPGFYSGIQIQYTTSSTTTINAGVVSAFSDFTMSGSTPAITLGLTHGRDANKRISVQTILCEEQADVGDHYQLYTCFTGVWSERSLHLVSEVNVGYEFANTMYSSSRVVSGLLGAYYDLLETIQAGLRLEGMYDPQGALADSRFNKPLPYNTLSMAGITTTVTYRPTSWSLIRADARYLGVLDDNSYLEIDPEARERTELVLSVDVFFHDLYSNE